MAQTSDATRETDDAAQATVMRPPAELPRGRFFEYVVALVSSWLLPGAGHWVLGYRRRALLLFALVSGLFWGGQHLAEYRAVNRDIHKWFFCAQVANGFSTLISNRLWGQKREISMQEEVDKDISRFHDTGVLFTSVAGLLNVLLVLHVADFRTWAGREVERREEGSGDGAAGPTQGGLS